MIIWLLLIFICYDQSHAVVRLYPANPGASTAENQGIRSGYGIAICGDYALVSGENSTNIFAYKRNGTAWDEIQISQELLNLIMFYHNHRRYKAGK
ncbi:MAG: hypothetical protein OMM_14391, partial [Candidatus Magnetoglobus multicellularis str. Araruama]